MPPRSVDAVEQAAAGVYSLYCTLPLAWLE
jgi:hypothetical protein